MPTRRPADVRTESRGLFQEATESGVEFCLVDIDLALSMLDRARLSPAREVRERCLDIVRRAHHSISELVEDLDMDAAQRARVCGRLEMLRDRLEDFA